jgi:hypothetical protein
VPRAGVAAEELPAVARPRLASSGGEPAATAAGTVFFLELPVGVAAVGAAHSFDLDELALAPGVEFRLGRTGELVASATRLLVPPGVPFTEAAGSLRDDFVVFALDAPPTRARVLSPAAASEVRAGERVRLLGVPAIVPQDEDDLFGRLVRAEEAKLEIELDVPADLRGWGGAPVLSARTGRVLGILEAARPKDGGLALDAAPIQAVLDAAAQPLEGGRGAPFARFAPKARAARGEAALRAGARPTPARDAEAGSVDPERLQELAAIEEEVLRDEGDFSEGERRPAPLLGVPRPASKLDLTIEHPPPRAIFGGTAGAFLAGHAVATLGELRRFDVVLVLDTSSSTGEMTGADVNQNGVVGRGGFRSLFGDTDPGDSILAAEVAAAKRLLANLDPRSARVGLVTFAGEPAPTGLLVIGRPPPPALTEVPLTAEFVRVEHALDRVLSRGAEGGTHMAAGLDQATVELLGLRGGLSEASPKSSKVVLFLTDGLPTLPVHLALAENVYAAIRAADRARKARIQVHTFALGPEALSGPIAPIEMAERTGGTFTPLRDPEDVVPVLEAVNLANIDELRVRNLTSGAEADEVQLGLDGSFSALVPLVPGRNRVEVYARASDGAEARREIELQHAPDAPTPDPPARLAAERNELLERRLAALKRVGLEVERAHAEEARRELALRIERERAQAQERAAAQRRELRIEAEREQRP